MKGEETRDGERLREARGGSEASEMRGALCFRVSLPVVWLLLKDRDFTLFAPYAWPQHNAWNKGKACCKNQWYLINLAKPVPPLGASLGRIK